MTTNTNDKLDYLIALATLGSEENDLNDPDLSDDSIQFDRSYYRKRSSYIRRYRRRDTVRALKTFALRMAIFTVLLTFSTVVLIGCVPQLNDTIYYSVSKWYDEYATLKYGPSTVDPNASGADYTLFPPDHIQNIVAPYLLPDNLIAKTVMSDKKNNQINYYKDEIAVLSFSQSTLDEREISFDSTDSVYYTVDISGISGIAVENEREHTNYLYWSDGNYLYELNSNQYSVGSLVRIAENVK